MDEIANRVKSLLDARAAAAQEDQATVVAQLVALRDANDDVGLRERVSALQRDAARLRGRAQQALYEAILLAELPDRFGAGGLGSRPTFTELALYQQITFLPRIGHRAEALAYADPFIERYPDSLYLAGVQSAVRQIRSDSERRATAVAKQPSIEADVQWNQLERQCRVHPDFEARQQACEDVVQVGLAQGRTVSWLPVATVVCLRGDEAARKALLAQAKQVEPSKAEYLEMRFACMRSPDYVIERAKRSFRERNLQLFGDQALSSMAPPDRREWVPKMLERWPNAIDAWWLAFRISMHEGRIRDAQARLAQFAERFPDDPRLAPMTTELDTGLKEQAEVAEPDARMHYEYATRWERGGLYAEAADAWVSLHDVDPTFEGLTGPKVLLKAAQAMRQSKARDWDLRTKALYERIVATYPNSPEAQRAASDLEVLTP